MSNFVKIRAVDTVLFHVNTPTEMMKLGVALRSFANESKMFEVSKNSYKSDLSRGLPS